MKRQIVVDSYDESHETELILLIRQQDTALINLLLILRPSFSHILRISIKESP